MDTNDTHPLCVARKGPARETSYVYTPPSHRLLFRGSLSIPGSRLLLEGLTFTVPLDRTTSLLDNPLALSLESMRGRTLALAGTVRLDQVYLDKSTDVSVDIHPAASLTRLYLSNQLCVNPITSPSGTTDTGIRIALGDPKTPSTSEILIYGKLPPAGPADASVGASSSSSPSKAPTLCLLVARVLPAPPTPATCRPRPDDPSPRVPPLVQFGKKRVLTTTSISNQTTNKRKRGDGGKKAEQDGMVERARDVMLGRADLRRNVSVADDDVFKVPSVPSAAGKSEAVRDREKGKEKKKVAAKDKDKGSEDVSDLAKELEKANKAAVKRATMECLASFNITREHSDFKQLFSFIYHGTEFALRAQMRARAVDPRAMDCFVRAHAEMYVQNIVTASSGLRLQSESQVFDGS
ncbi:hypothetical protein K488DRAFT_82921 [Vararia minispora EC-137]|uniref:Uncharacterized protein n=1 Tax=Vararia minispora EC-137 TaxID=1314806 RepID=A0ACB8QUM1_9AGAM|nr:hypothetical protein K488DRAFT_82921 [Vararia minispora EC-137]